MAYAEIEVPVQSFAELCRLEPKLAELAAEIGRFSATCDDAVDAERSWYEPGGFKERLLRLIGWCRLPPGYVAPVRPSRRDPDEPKLLAEALDELVARRRATAEAWSRLTPEQREREELLSSSPAYELVYRRLYADLFSGVSHGD